MKFAHTQFLFLIWVLPLLILVKEYGRRRRNKVMHGFADRRALDMLVPTGLAARRRLRAALMLTAALLLVIAMAGPQYGFEWQTVERRGVDLMIVLDCSRSMLAQDIQPTRLDRAKREIVDLLAMMQGDRAGLVAFSGSAFLQCPLTLDYAAFDLFLSVLTPDYLPIGGTDLNAAVQTALDGFDTKSAADKAIILITDGEHTGRGDPEEAARTAHKSGVKLFCIGIGSAQGVPVPADEGGFKKDTGGQIVLTRLDEPLLTRMALAAGGAYVRSVAGDMDLDVIYRDRIRGEMESATLESGRKQVWADRYQWPLTLAVLLLYAAGAVPAVKKSLVSFILLAFLFPPSLSQAGPLQDGYRAYQQGQYEEALKNFVDGQLADPDNPAILYNIGNTYYKMGHYEAAKDHFSQALSQAPLELKTRLLYNLGNSAYRLGALPEAVQNYQAALQLAPEDSQAQDNLEFVRRLLQQQSQQGGNGSQKSEEKTRPEDPPTDRTASSDPQDASSETEPSGPDEADRPKPNERHQPDSDPASQAPAPRYGSEMDPRQTHHTGNAPEEQPTGEQIGSMVGERSGADRKTLPPAADRMLDRLKDEPGRAMMPAYGKQAVDKDW